MIIFKIRNSQRRIWEYYLRKKFMSKKNLGNLVELLIAQTVADEAKKELEKIK
jgi:hypothetical protein